MRTPTEFENFVIVDQCASTSAGDELRGQEQDPLRGGGGFVPRLTKAYRAPKMVSHIVATS